MFFYMIFINSLKLIVFLNTLSYFKKKRCHYSMVILGNLVIGPGVLTPRGLSDIIN